ncbi:MAG: efflux RND transporter periplasmic adaptor subunit, partial [Muribaculaceae bacterium]|nr:efflux RND transporter periplasmic adaptor subunit [Muribaculaceae bacterium]
SGSTGTVLIPHQADSVILIPQKATFEIQDRRYVYVVNDSNKTVSNHVEVLDLSDGQNFVVKSGLNAGERIAVEGVGVSLRDGMFITPKEAVAQ